MQVTSPNMSLDVCRDKDDKQTLIQLSLESGAIEPADMFL